MIPFNFKYKGILTAQHENVIEVFKKLLINVKPCQILEIGTYHGGLSNILLDLIIELKLNTIIKTYDIVKHCDIKEKENLNIIVENIFNHDYSVVNNNVKDFIQRDGTTIVLCDGGNKIKEFNLLSKYIKNNDIIMAHDYAPNSDIFYQKIQNKIWDFWEICDNDIINSIEMYNLEPFMEDEFIEIAWLCKIKKIK